MFRHSEWHHYSELTLCFCFALLFFHPPHTESESSEQRRGLSSSCDNSLRLTAGVPFSFSLSPTPPPFPLLPAPAFTFVIKYPTVRKEEEEKRPQPQKQTPFLPQTHTHTHTEALSFFLPLSDTIGRTVLPDFIEV